MKDKIKIVFEEDPAVCGIDVVIRARCRDGEVDALIDRVTGRLPDALTAADEDGSLCKINYGDIVSVSVCGKIVQIVTENGRFTARQPLQSFEDKPEMSRFIRISRYEIINLDKVIRFDFTLAGTLRIELAGGMETWASRRNIPMIRKKLTERE